MGAEAETDACATQALLYTTMCVIGLPVDVLIRDGSVYSGIFHTASLDQEYGVVLKEARLTKKGSCKANVADGSVIETLVILSCDLVQVVAKGVLFPDNVVKGNVCGHDMQSSEGHTPVIAATEAEKSNKSNMDKRKIHQNRSPARNKNSSSQSFMSMKAEKEHEGEKMPVNHLGDAIQLEPGKTDGLQVSKIDEVPSASRNERQIGDDRLQLGQDNDKNKIEFPREESAGADQKSSSILGCCLAAKPVEEQVMIEVLPNGGSCDTASESYNWVNESFRRPASVDASSPISTTSSPMLEVVTESCSSASTDLVALHHLDANVVSKEFKLNPEAKSFSPSFSNPQSNTPAVPAVGSMAYAPSGSPTIPVVSRASVSAKLAPYSNMTAENGSAAQFLQPIVGHVGSKTHQIRHAGPYHAVPSAPACVPPNSQAVVVGRPGQHVYVYPVPHDLVQGTAAVSHVSVHPLLTPHQVYYSMHQGGGAGQPLQLYVPQPYVAGGQQPFAVPGQIPLLQPSIPPHRPNHVPGSNTFYRTKIP